MLWQGCGNPCPASLRLMGQRVAGVRPQRGTRRCSRSPRPASAARAPGGGGRRPAAAVRMRGRSAVPPDRLPLPRWRRGDRLGATTARHRLPRAAPLGRIRLRRDTLSWRLCELVKRRIEHIHCHRPSQIAHPSSTESRDRQTDQKPQSPLRACHTWKYQFVQLRISRDPCAEKLCTAGAN